MLTIVLQRSRDEGGQEGYSIGHAARLCNALVQCVTDVVAGVAIEGCWPSWGMNSPLKGRWPYPQAATHRLRGHPICESGLLSDYPTRLSASVCWYTW